MKPTAADDNGLRHGISVAELCCRGKSGQQNADIDVHHKIDLVLGLVNARPERGQKAIEARGLKAIVVDQGLPGDRVKAL